MDHSMTMFLVSAFVVAISWGSYLLGRYRREHDFVIMLHDALLTNIEECKDTVYAADVMSISLIAGIEGVSLREYRDVVRIPKHRHQVRLKARELIEMVQKGM